VKGPGASDEFFDHTGDATLIDSIEFPTVALS
jgi:hypothetical protein